MPVDRNIRLRTDHYCDAISPTDLHAPLPPISADLFDDMENEGGHADEQTKDTPTISTDVDTTPQLKPGHYPCTHSCADKAKCNHSKHAVEMLGLRVKC